MLSAVKSAAAAVGAQGQAVRWIINEIDIGQPSGLGWRRNQNPNRATADA